MTNTAVSVLLVEDNPIDVCLARVAMKASKLQLDLTVVEDGELALDDLSRRGAYDDFWFTIARLPPRATPAGV